ncbi:oxidative stress-induced growth inhibitor 1-like [Atheta coriaria]|uniref:oxidative stress-induced growth inhibitor 1-like n=1 Tax=Dalotia coriaria TaxID=877792 RepID=UPI0031F41900
MKCGNSNELIHKDVVIIGNGPSGIALSYMLSGNIPYVTSTTHPDELLSIRLEPVLNQSLVDVNLPFLSQGLEGRTTNPVSLLLDSLVHPCADIGLELDSLVEWRKDGQKIDHVVLGKGPPGGSWHSMDPDILTLSLGSWMSLPGMKYQSRNSSEKRAPAKSIADYYARYVEEMGLSQNFRNKVLVTKIEPYIVDESDCKGKWVEKVNNDICQKMRLCSRPERKDLARSKSYSLSNAFNYILNRGQDRCPKRSWEQNEGRDMDTADDQRDIDAQYTVRKKRDKDRSISLSSACELTCDKCNLNNGHTPSVPAHRIKYNCCDSSSRSPRWIVEAIDLDTKACVRYTCNNLVLANGSSDLPNKLNISKYKTDPYWLLHDLRSLEIELDLHLQNNPQPDPVLVVGAGLSAADAIIATKAKNVPVVHLFRNKTDLTKQLPENMYPEYHKVHQMMKNGSNYPLYTALAEYTLTSLDEYNRKATITSKDGKSLEISVSYVVVLIGSRPDLGFLPGNFNLGVKRQLPIDGKKNTANVDKFTHQVQGHEGLYAIGPLAGDNFVRFLPGGALAVLSDIVKRTATK